ncbi:AimR family lysis-lysogeny pheromone receptor [Priestia megaterium]|uniref:AimR family lysis-lysogeny pheromone receptor n=1 Tax=Priestia megaterium TaxID=1404 RepID=UPI000BF9EC58|nr:AimR family lysis-lysogeny pheromone receptor [Priestia megaterium]PFR93556.1 hypothetical protein COK39_17870 [Priestia megaterium]
MTVVKKLLNIIDVETKKKGITRGDIAKRLGVSNGTVTNIFSRKHKISHLKFIELTKIAFDKYHHEYILEFCRNAKVGVEIDAMEWAYANAGTEILKTLIERDKKQKKTNPITAVYELQLKRMTGKINSDCFLNESENLKFTLSDHENYLETLILLGISTIYAFVDLAAYRAVQSISRNLLDQIQNIENPYLKEAYEIRVELALIFSFIRSRELSKGKELALKIVNSDVCNKLPLYYNNALIYMTDITVLTSYKESSRYISKAVEMMEEGYFDGYTQRKGMIKSTSDFVNIHHNHFKGLYLEDLAEQAHYHAKKKDLNKALFFLNKLERKNGRLSNFQKYYKGLALNDLNLMRQAKDGFYKSGDFHYVKLPENYIENSNKIS